MLEHHPVVVGHNLKTMNKLIYISIVLLLILACNSNKEHSAENEASNFDITKISIEVSEPNSALNIIANAENQVSSSPIHGQISQDLLIKYFPGITDTIKDLRIFGSERIGMNPGNGIIVSILHNTGTFDQMILCTHDSSLNLIDNYYIGEATMFDKTSHTIEYDVIDESTLGFDHFDWGNVKEGNEFEIDTVNIERYSIRINEQGKIKKYAQQNL